MTTLPHVLLVDDDSEGVLSLVRALKSAPINAHFHAAGNAEEAMKIFSGKKPSVIVLDLCIDESQGVSSGFSLLQQFLSLSEICRVIILTGNGSTEYGVRAISLGAAHFLEKPADIPHLTALINDGLSQAALRAELSLLRNKEISTAFVGIIGESTKTKDLIGQVQYAAQTSQPVLLSGETGTGKGLCAMAIHRLGGRSANRFIRYQPTFLTPDLVNSELFGHVKGAFTGASEPRKGLLAEANHGTLFLDEINELPQETQIALLGVLQDKVMRPVGSNQEQPTDFRLITAVGNFPEECLASGTLRKDFYHRIAHLRIHLPPLRERREDIPSIASHVLAQLREKEEADVHEVSDDALFILSRYDWPGNIRELDAVVEAAAYHAQFKGRKFVLPEDVRCGTSDSGEPAEERDFHANVETYRRRLVEEALARNGGNQVRAAAEIGLDRKSIARILKRRASN